MSKLDRLIKLARVVRSAYEKIYGKHGDLGGACFDASRQLFLLAKDNGLAVEIGIGDGHVVLQTFKEERRQCGYTFPKGSVPLLRGRRS